MTKPIVGAQLYTLRDFCKTPSDIEQTLKKVRDIGYSAVQLSGLGAIDPAELARMLDRSSLAAAATHINWNRCLTEIDAVVAEHKMWKCRHVAIGGLWGDYTSLDGVRKFIAEERAVGERLAKEGMTFSYHNHNHEFAKPAGADRTWLAIHLSQWR